MAKPIPNDKKPMIEQACLAVAVAKAEETGVQPDQRALAYLVILSGDNQLPYAICKAAESRLYPDGFDWSAMTPAELQTAIEDIWETFASAEASK